jgi:D-xylose 1-dehydrogenase (NADP+, D-xylono-1,5-lactone-forming)
MPKGNLRWGVLSTAHIGQVAVNPAIHASRNGTLVAIASRDRARAQELADRWKVPSAFGSYEALLDSPDVDAVYVPLPNSLHREWTIRAAERKKHVLCEKPLALSPDEALEMHAAATQHGVKLMEAFMYRFHPRTERVIEIVSSGRIGRPLAIQAAFTFRLRPGANIRLAADLGGGALMDVGCYCVNLSRTLAGVEPVEAQAWAEWGPTGVDTRLAGSLRFPTGLIAQLDCALSLERRERYEVAGPEGSIAVSSAFVPGMADTMIEERRGRADITGHLVPAADQYRLMVEHFADCVLLDQPVRYPATEAAANLRAIEALYLSARSDGRPIPLIPPARV